MEVGTIVLGSVFIVMLINVIIMAVRHPQWRQKRRLKRHQQRTGEMNRALEDLLDWGVTYLNIEAKLYHVGVDLTPPAGARSSDCPIVRYLRQRLPWAEDVSVGLTSARAWDKEAGDVSVLLPPALMSFILEYDKIPSPSGI